MLKIAKPTTGQLVPLLALSDFPSNWASFREEGQCIQQPKKVLKPPDEHDFVMIYMSGCFEHDVHQINDLLNYWAIWRT